MTPAQAAMEALAGGRSGAASPARRKFICRRKASSNGQVKPPLPAKAKEPIIPREDGVECERRGDQWWLTVTRRGVTREVFVPTAKFNEAEATRLAWRYCNV